MLTDSLCPKENFTGRSLWKRLALLGLVFLITWIGGAFGRIWYQQQLLHVSCQTQTLEKEIQKLQRQRTQLQMKIAQIHSPNLLQSLAGQLHSPTRECLIHVAWQDLHQNTRHVADGGKSQQRKEIVREPSKS